jgi:hypothetical protein
VKVLVIGRSKPFTDARLIERLLRADGHRVVHVDDRKLRQLVGGRAGSAWIRARAGAFRPDRVLTFKPHDIRLEVYAWLTERFPVTLWYRDLNIPPDPEMVARARLADAAFITPGGQVPAWRALGVERARFLPSAADPAEAMPGAFDPALACQVAFVGRGYDAARAEFLCRLAERFDVRVWGQDWGPWAERLRWDGTTVYGEKFGHVCASAEIVLDIQPSFQVAEEVWGYLSNRPFRIMAAGAFMLGHATAGARALLQDGTHAAFYEDEEDAAARIEQWLADAAGRARVAAAGQAFVLRHHTFAARLPHLLTGDPWVNPLGDDGDRPAEAPA